MTGSHTVNVIDMCYTYIKRKAQERNTTMTDIVSRIILNEMEREENEYQEGRKED